MAKIATKAPQTRFRRIRLSFQEIRKATHRCTDSVKRLEGYTPDGDAGLM
jgi:hypothetical protein